MLIHQTVFTGAHVAWFDDSYDSIAIGFEDCRAFWPGATVSVQRLRPNHWQSVEPEDCIVVEIVAGSEDTRTNEGQRQCE
jgi:hypothetical protein